VSYLPRALASVCACVPVVALGFIIVSTFVQALPAFARVGLGLFSAQPNSANSLLAPLWGTFVASTEALVIGLPIALAIAVVKREFQVPVLSQALNGIVGTLGGIPPVIYAICTLFLVQSFMAPKFAGVGIPDPRVQAAIICVPVGGFGGLPDRVPNTFFLGGVLLAMLIVPFMTPLIDDALRSVPADLKNGSHALGATRRYTLQHIVLPALCRA
jgi:phosphate transport system permease protein